MYKNYTHKLWLVMRITTVLLIAAIMQVSAAGFSQRITLTKKNTPLEDVLRELHIQSGYDFLFDREVILKAKSINIQITDVSLKEALDASLSGLSLSYHIKDKSVIIKAKPISILERMSEGIRAMFQEIDVRGVVLDEQGNPLVGATVSIKGTGLGQKTNEKGEFLLTKVDDQALILISYLGYETRVLKAMQAMGSIVMTMSTGKLDEVSVVSTGYQQVPKERATGSYELVDNKLFNRIVSTDLISRLNETVPGLYFNTRVRGTNKFDNMTVRGISSLSQTKPLVVLDNVAYEGDLNNINPNDVESITVLKDAAAASIWGSRAGNGVIVITSKKGGYDRPMRISLNANFEIFNKTDLFTDPQISVSDFIDFEKFMYSNGYYEDILSPFNPYPEFVTPVIQILDNKNLSEAQKNSQIDALRQYDVRKDYSKYIYRAQFNQQYALNISGGSKQSNYFVSGGYDKKLNELVTSDYSRMTLRSNYNFKPVKDLEIQTGILFTQSRTNDPTENSRVVYQGGQQINIYPYARLADEQGNPLEPGGYFGMEYLDELAKNPALKDWHYKPLADLYKSSKKGSVQDILFNVGANYKLNTIFSAELRYQYQSANAFTTSIDNADSYFVRNLINKFTNPTTLVSPIPNGALYTPVYGRNNAQTIRGQLNANKTWADKHQLVAIAGAELRKNYGELNNEGYHFGYDANTKKFLQMDALSNYPLFHGGTAKLPGIATYSDTDNRNTSLFANAAYTYDNRFIVSASARKDASNIFGDNTNKKGNPLWSAGASWNISNEFFYQSKLVPYLKLRATYGYSGTTVTGTSAFAVISSSVNQITQLPYGRGTNLANPNLSWEKVRMMNVGLDFSTKNNRISGSIEYYDKSSTDVLAPTPVDLTSGFKSQIYNTANLRGKGVDLNLKSINLDLGGFTWGTDLVMSYNKTMVSKYKMPVGLGNSYVGLAFGINPIEGKVAYSVLAYKWAGLDPETGDPRGYLNGQISKDYDAMMNVPVSETVTFGSSVPIYHGAIRNNFDYKGISLSFNILYKLKYYFSRNSLGYEEMIGINAGNAEYAQRWQKPGDETHTNVPSLVYPLDYNRDAFYRNSEASVEKGDHIRLQDITAGYTFKKVGGLKNLRLYANMSNLGIIWRANKKDVDPDYQFGTAIPKSIALGLTTNF
jgi:TonB-linked SusC/RagA family outer membrane protein